jgi:hypothetical protein
MCRIIDNCPRLNVSCAAVQKGNARSLAAVRCGNESVPLRPRSILDDDAANHGFARPGSAIDESARVSWVVQVPCCVRAGPRAALVVAPPS